MEVISQHKLDSWLETKELKGIAEIISSQTYYGLNIRGRPGALYIINNQLFHWSYKQGSTFLAIGEKERKICIPIENIAEVSKIKIGIFWGFMFLKPESVYRIIEKNGLEHQIVFYQDSEQFLKVMENRGVENI